MRLFACIIVLLAMLAPRTARAEDVSGKAYDDLKFVAEELISMEFAEGATVWLTCNARFLPQYYVGSLGQLSQRQVGILKTTLRDETVTAIADYLYWSLDRKQGEGVNLESFLAQPVSWKISVKHDKDTLVLPLRATPARPGARVTDPSDICGPSLDPSHAWHADARKALLAYLRTPSNATQSTEVDKCDPSQPRCELARSFRAAMQDKPAQAQSELLRFVMESFFQTPELEHAEPIRAQLRSLLVGSLKDGASPQNLSNFMKPVLEALQGVTVESLNCPDTKALLEPTERLHYLATVKPEEKRSALMCLITQGVAKSLGGAAVRFTADGKSYFATIDEIVKAGVPNATDEAAFLALACRTSLNGAPPPGCGVAGGTPPTTGEVEIAGLTWEVASKPSGRDASKTVIAITPKNHPSTVGGTARPPATLAGVVTGAVKYRELKDRFVERLTTMFPDAQISDSQRRPLAVVLLRVSSLARDLDQLRLYSEGDKLEYQGLLKTVLSVIKTAPQLCDSKAKSSDVCTKATGIATLLENADVQRILTLATRKDYRSLALESLRLGTQGVEEEECSVDHPRYSHLVISFVTYVLDDSSGADGRTVSRDAFRAAAIDTLRCSSTSGLDRSWRGGREAFIHLLFRDIALRASWNQGYRNEVGTDGYRTTVTISGFTYHRRFTPSQSAVYAGIELTALDWAAPLSELALRRADANYDNPGMVAADIVRPRVDIMVGLPVLSERLAASAGVCWRLVAPVPGSANDSATNPTPNSFTYLPFWSGDDRLKRNSHATFIEFSIGAHYMF